MKKQYTLLFMAMLCLWGNRTMAQWLPPVYFPSGTNLCDSRPWKLIIFDDFNGNAIDNNKWITFNSWNGMKIPLGNGDTLTEDHDNWSEGRMRDPYVALFRDDNIIVGGGTVKLLARNQTTTWQCDTCTTVLTKHLTSATIALPFIKRGSNGVSNHFNSGRFEFRARFPSFKGSTASFYLWHGSGVNEIDFVETYGGSYTAVNTWNRPRNTFNLHAWKPKPNNPYGLQDEVVEGSNRYPTQTWWDNVWGNNVHLRQTNWHTYTVEVDTAKISFYFDHVLQKTVWKYYMNIGIAYFDGSSWITYPAKISPTCANLPLPGNWNITKGYPYNRDANMQLRIGPGFRSGVTGEPGKNYTYGEMEVDYIKIWHRNPEEDGHTEICTGGFTNAITGPSTLCGPTLYGLQYATPGGNGTWSTSNNGVTLSGGAGGSAVTVTANPYSNIATTTLFYTYNPQNGACPSVTLSRVINTGAGSIPAQVGVVRVRNFWLTTQKFQLTASPSIPGAAYSWKIWYGTPGINNNYMTATGTYVNTATIMANPLFPYYINWELTINTSCGSRIVTGSNSNMPFATPLAGKPETYLERDSSAFYLEARMDDHDVQQYEQMVAQIVANEFIEDPKDTAAIAEIIGKIRMEELEPYLYFEGTENEDPGNNEIRFARMEPENDKNATNKSKVYPNPATKALSVFLSSKFDLKNEVQYKINNLLGNQEQQGALKDLIDVSALSDGVYLLEIKQGAVVEYVKFVKE